MSGTPNPVRQITGLTDTSNVSKADLISWALSHVPQVLADAADINARDLAGQLIIKLKSNGRTYALDTSDTTTADDGLTCIRDFNGLAFKVVTISGLDGINGIDGASNMTRARVVDVGAHSPSTDYANGDTIDGVTLATNNILLRATPGGNAADGLYLVPSSGAASRVTAFNSYDSMPGCYFSVMEGTTYHDTLWRCISDQGGTLGTTALIFAKTTLPIGDISGLGTGVAAALEDAIGTAGAFITSPHLVVYTVAPSGASTADKAKADYVGNGTADDIAVNAAITAAGTTVPSKIVLLPGNYTGSAEVDINLAPGSTFDAEGTVWNGESGTVDDFTINKSNVSGNMYDCVFRFGSIKHNSSGSAIRNYGNDAYQTISWQAIQGTALNGTGYYCDAYTGDGGAGQSVMTLLVGALTNLNYGIHIKSDTNVDTIYAYPLYSGGFISDCNKGVFIESSESGNAVNSNVWRLNLDCSVVANSVGFQSNGKYDILDLTVGGRASGAHNVQFDSGALNNDASRMIPQSAAYAAGSIQDNSGNSTNFVNPSYSQGTWTPTLGGTSTAGSPTYTVQSGTYEQIGRLIKARFYLQVSSLGTAAGNIVIGGLPFTSLNSTTDIGWCILFYYSVAGLAASTNGVTGIVQANTKNVWLYSGGNAAGSQVTVAQVGNSAILVGSCEYRI